MRTDLANTLLSHSEDANDPFLSHMVWFGISPLKADSLLQIAKECTWPKVTRWIARKLATEPEALNALLAINSSDDVLEGMAEAFKGIRKAPKPASWDKIVATSRSPHLRDLSILFGDGRALDDVKKIALDDKAEITARESALKTLIEARPDDLRELCTKLIDVRGLNTTAARGLALFDDPEIGKQLAKNYRKFADGIMDTLVSRPAFAQAMLAEMTDGRIPRTELSAFHARQIRSFNNEALSKQLTEAWGEFRESAADKKQLIAKMKADLKPDVLAKANLSNGRVLFTAVCGTCHVMYGQGGKIGPDLTGSGRANLDYLLENMADPSAIVPADYRMTFITHKDGRVLSGLLSAQAERTLTLRTLTGDITLDRTEIANQNVSPLSMMPEGILSALPPEQLRDLIAYLMHPVQVK